jgi:arylsulfatase A-like enzyme
MRPPLLALALALPLPAQPPAEPPPNIVLIFTDDQGWADLGVQGATGFATPHLDRLAADGVRFTDFYVAQPVCSASRAALLTGCYPNRIGIAGALGPGARIGLHPDETTLAEVCKQRGHRTAIYGKWHLGHLPPFLPMRHGFDDWYGIPYSNDMWPKHPENPEAWGDLPTHDRDEVVGRNTDQDRFTGDFTERAVRFIEASVAAGEPFFVYLAHPMPHVPLHASAAFRGRSARGLYGDVIEEIDASVGRVLATLDAQGVADDTLVVYASDNGPWLSYGDHAGSTGPFREGKGTTFEGGVRVPCIWRWPGRIPAGRIQTEPAMTIDVLPTIARILGVELPEREIDGRDIGPLLRCEDGARSPHEALFFWYGQNDLEALRSGRFKLHFPHGYRSMIGRSPGRGGIPGKYDYEVRTGLQLYDLAADPGETTDIAAAHPEVVARLQGLADQKRRELGDRLTKVEGRRNREPGRMPQPSRDTPAAAAPTAAQNLVILLADDLGAGDLRCYDPAAKIPTPHFDRLAAAGMRFVDAHSPSSVCTPTRYALLTGRYAWRTRLERGVLDGYGRALIAPGEATIASFAAAEGLDTAVFGKWHLGLGSFDPARPGQRADFDQPGPFDAGPHTQGFRTSRVIPASLDMAPYVWVHDGALEQLPTAVTPGGRRRWDGGPGFWRAGPIAPDFRIDRVLEETVRDAVAFVAARRPSDPPFFLYVPFSAPHTPWLPSENFEGRSEAGAYGDFVAEVDAGVGAILDALDRAGLAASTLFVATSDNGAHWRPQDRERYGHDSHDGRRGMKADIHEAGHRVPLLVRWPGVTAAGSRSAALVGLNDLFATCADALGRPLPAGAAPDSRSFAAVLRGAADTARDHLVHHSADGMFAIRVGDHKWIEGLGSGGFTAPARAAPREGGPFGQLYDLARDPGETRNLCAEQPERVAELRRRLAEVRGLRAEAASGR